jgi:hypothetical protein
MHCVFITSDSFVFITKSTPGLLDNENKSAKILRNFGHCLIVNTDFYLKRLESSSNTDLRKLKSEKKFYVRIDIYPGFYSFNVMIIWHCIFKFKVSFYSENKFILFLCSSHTMLKQNVQYTHCFFKPHISSTKFFKLLATAAQESHVIVLRACTKLYQISPCRRLRQKWFTKCIWTTRNILILGYFKFNGILVA